ncbi:NADH:flavin oxidoreductase [Candidatus Bipolaricaulota bacterium]
MSRTDYAMYSPARIGQLEVPNRFVRSATADLAPWKLGRYTDEDVRLYRTLAQGGVGLMIVNGPATMIPEAACEGRSFADWPYDYEQVRVGDVASVLSAIRDVAPQCKVMAQLECNALISGDHPAAPSPVRSPYYEGPFRALEIDEIEAVVAAAVETIVHMKEEGFDGIQLHAAHGGGLWYFLSPAGNWRTDRYGGSTANRVRVVADIVAGVRQRVGDFPILIKANCTDNLERGLDMASFPELARALEAAGIDAIEVSGGTWDALVRSEEELGFRPVPAAESHTGILDPEKQNYYQPYVQDLQLDIPLILVGGIRNAEKAEAVIQSGAADFVAMCRPLIREPHLIERWRSGSGPADAACIACNSCIYSMHLDFEKMRRKTVTCLPAHDASLHAEAQGWLKAFIDEIRVDR